MLWLLTLPFRLVFGLVFAIVGTVLAIVFLPLILLLWVPFMLLRGAFKLVGALFCAVLVAVGLALGGVVLFAAILVPLFPVMLLVGGLWLVYRMMRPRPIVV